MSLRALATVVVTTVMMLPHAWADTAWESYKSRFMMPDGRIIDTGNGNVSHTEGQGFAMLLAVGNNDRPAFDKLWQWTDKTLRNKDNGLFYWRYNPVAPNPVADKNDATDGDTLIAWALLRAQQQAISIPNIQKTVADYYGLQIKDLLSKRRTRSLARPRQVAMALSKELTEHSLPEIGDAFGGRDHTTVLHACRKIAELREADADIREDYKNLLRTLTT